MNRSTWKLLRKKLSIHILSENMKIDAIQNFQIQLHTSDVFNCLERFIHYEANIQAPWTNGNFRTIEAERLIRSRQWSLRYALGGGGDMLAKFKQQKRKFLEGLDDKPHETTYKKEIHEKEIFIFSTTSRPVLGPHSLGNSVSTSRGMNWPCTWVKNAKNYTCMPSFRGEWQF